MLSRLASSSVSWILGLATMTNSYHLLTSHTNIPFKAWLCPARLLVASHVQSLDLTPALKNKRQISFALYLLFFLHFICLGDHECPGAHVETRRQLWEAIPSSYLLGLRGRTPVLRPHH